MRKQERLEKKKRKTAALVNMIKINEIDKIHEKNSEEPEAKKSKLNLDIQISDDQYKLLKKELAERRNALQNAPKFRLKFFGEKATLLTNPTKRQPLMFEDIQYLLMTSLLGSSSPFKPDRWCVLEKANRITHTVVLVIEGLTSYNFTANESQFIRTKGIFEHQLELVLPKYKKNRLVEEISNVPLTQSHKESLIKQYGSLEAALKLNKDPNTMFSKSLFPIDIDTDSEEQKIELNENETFPRTRLLLSPLQMMIEGYPIPIKGEYEERYRGYRSTKSIYKPVTSKSPMFGLDCEMCRTIKSENELARVSIVDENFKSIYETLVRPENKIVNYLTPWSGITKEMMENVTKTLKEVQEEVSNLLPADAILVGQSLNCDLNAMKLMHPYVIDTSVIYNLSGDRNRKSKLQHLTKHFLNEEIQIDKLGHSSIEDSIACLKLTKLKLSKDIYFGDVALEAKKSILKNEEGKIGIVKDIESSSNVKTPIFSHALKRQKKSVIVSTHNCEINLKKSMLMSEGSEDHGIKHFKENSIKKVVKKTKEILLDHDFILSHINIFNDFVDEENEKVDCSSEEKIAEIVPKIDKWIEKVWSNVATNGIFVVIFGGRDLNSNGVSMVQIKS
ncbi:hypothetical protein PVAND_016321 [Polypedilum vanderplanki]|uniref:Exonuclease domain-containing protein n=1 Tax=Polypedilum vanderplanki TaxID=319348 RepID=A0A9J6BF47_POLVA|nr:hypothetical protein PVAND_016321 [Polypedilum vanderplanki]